MPVKTQLAATSVAHVHHAARNFGQRLAKTAAPRNAQTTWKDGNAAEPLLRSSTRSICIMRPSSPTGSNGRGGAEAGVIRDIAVAAMMALEAERAQRRREPLLATPTGAKGGTGD